MDKKLIDIGFKKHHREENIFVKDLCPSNEQELSFVVRVSLNNGFNAWVELYYYDWSDMSQNNMSLPLNRVKDIRSLKKEISNLSVTFGF